jgi:hypothetical protein
MESLFGSAKSQQATKLNLSDSFSNEEIEDSNLSRDEISALIDQIFTTLIKSKVLPKDYPRPETSLSSLSRLIDTICDEFLLEIDLPSYRTHTSTRNPPSVQEPRISFPGNSADDLINRIFKANKSFVLTEQNCRDLTCSVIELSKKSQSHGLREKTTKLEGVLIRYTEELVKTRKTIKQKEIEIQRLKNEIEFLKHKSYDGSLAPKQCRPKKTTSAVSESTDAC